MRKVCFITILLSLFCIANAEDTLNAKKVLGKTPILFTVHAPDKTGTHRYTYQNEFLSFGSALKVLNPATGQTRTLVSAKEGIIRRPDVHFDGKHIVFTMSKNRKDNFHIYEIEINPKKLFTDTNEIAPKQLTFAPDVSDVDPIYMPEEKIAFCSTRDIKYVPCDSMLCPQIFKMDRDGANIHQITRSTVHENEISLMPNGRILYSRWDYVDRNFGDGHGFWVTNPDGSNTGIIWGNNSAHPAAGWTSRMIPDTGEILCILGTHHRSLGGALAILNPRKAIDNRESIVKTWPKDVIKRFENPEKLDLETANPKDGIPVMTKIWPEEAKKMLPTSHNFRLHAWNDDLEDVEPWYHTPYPLSDKHFLCVRAESRTAPPAIYLIGRDGGETKLYEEEPGCYAPIPLAPHPRPTIIPSRRDYAYNDGHLFVQNVYEGTHMQGVEPGSIKYLRVVEVLMKRGLSYGVWNALGGQSPALNWSDFNAKRILGTVPVEKDGSASFLVPSDRFVYFQLLDKDEMMVQTMRSGTSIHSGETQGCIGCHESRTSTSLSSSTGSLTMALKRKPSKLKPWYGEERAFSYMVEIQPIFDKNCMKCHDFGGKASKKIILARDKGFAFNASYTELQHKGYTGAIGAGPAGHFPAKSWGSHTSPLIKLLKKGHAGIKLNKEEMDRLITWVDINSPYYPTTYAARWGPPPGRNPLELDMMKRFYKLTGFNENSMRKAKNSTGPLVSFDRPEKSPCIEKFIDDKVVYDEVLEIIKTGKEALERTPRADMPGHKFTPNETDQRRQLHHEKYWALEQKVREAIRNGTKIMDSPEANPSTMNL